jgi:hypothetical protein
MPEQTRSGRSAIIGKGGQNQEECRLARLREASWVDSEAGNHTAERAGKAFRGGRDYRGVRDVAGEPTRFHV